MDAQQIRERELQDRLFEIEAQLDEVAAEALAQGLRVRISCPTGHVIPEFHSPAVEKHLPAMRLVRYYRDFSSGGP